MATPPPRKPTPPATTDTKPAAASLLTRETPQLHTARAVLVYLAELDPSAPAAVVATNPARSIGRTRREALRLGDWSATALPFVTTRPRWLHDGEEADVLFCAQWAAQTLAADAAARATAVLGFESSCTEAAALLFAAVDREQVTP